MTIIINNTAIIIFPVVQVIEQILRVILEVFARVNLHFISA